MNLGINKIIKEGNGNALLFTAILAGAICNSLPTPMDSVYFSRMSQMKRDYEQGKISAEKYEWHLAGEYYIWTSLWYVGLGSVLLLMNKDYKTNVKLFFGLIAAGVVIGTVQKNIQKDKELEQLKSAKNG
jgi:hypothetical protein